MPPCILGGQRAYQVYLEETGTRRLDAFQTMEYEGSNTRAPRTQSFVRVTPGQAFNTVVHQYDEYEDESDIEIKAWINGQPTEAIAWLTTPSGPKYGGNFGEQIAVIESQLIRKGRYLYKVPLKIDPQLGEASDNDLMEKKVVVTLTRGKFRAEKALPDKSIIATRTSGGQIIDQNATRCGRKTHYVMITKDGIRPRPFHEFVLNLRTKEQLLAKGVIREGRSVYRPMAPIDETDNHSDAGLYFLTDSPTDSQASTLGRSQATKRQDSFFPAVVGTQNSMTSTASEAKADQHIEAEVPIPSQESIKLPRPSQNRVGFRGAGKKLMLSSKTVARKGPYMRASNLLEPSELSSPRILRSSVGLASSHGSNAKTPLFFPNSQSTQGSINSIETSEDSYGLV